MSNFNRQKNTKAAAYSLLLIGVLVLLCFTISWTPPSTAIPPVEEGMEVNLGDSETGEGDVQPLMPGDPATEEGLVSVSPPPPLSGAAPSQEKEVETNDEDKEAPPAVVKTPAIKPKEKSPVTPLVNTPPKSDSRKKNVPASAPSNVPTNPSNTEKNQPRQTVQAVATPTPTTPAPKPKYVLGAQQGGQGGNNAQSSVASNGQGIAGGKGDQGKPTGDPNSDSYTGTGGSGNGGIAVSRGLQGRKINRFPSFQDEFNENAKVAVDIKVDTRGNVLAASIQPRGTTTVSVSLKNIALQKAKQLKFTPDDEGAEEQLGTIIFDFRVRN